MKQTKSDKELAVELYCAYLTSLGSLLSNPNNFNRTTKNELPTTDEIAGQVQELTRKLERIYDC